MSNVQFLNLSMRIQKLSIHPWLKAILKSTFGKLYFKVATLNRALHSYFISSLHCSEGQGDYCSILVYYGTQKLFKIDRLPHSSYRKLCCSPLFLKNCEIYETVSKEEATVRQWETLCSWVTHSEIVSVGTSKFALFT